MIVWTEQAFTQLNQVSDYISFSGSEGAAERVVSRILSSVQQLAKFPLSGRPGRVPGTRELVIANTPSIVAYTQHENRIVVLAIYHGAQRWPEVF